MIRRGRDRRRGIGAVLMGFLAVAPAGGRLAAQPANQRVAAIGVAGVGLTVADLDRSIAFYTGVLGFVRVGETEVAGPEYERLTGVFGARIRVARLRLGEELIELSQYLAPEGRPIPVDTRSNDRWFQHVAIVVRDMNQAYQRLRSARVRFASTGPQLLPVSNPNAGGIRAFYFKDPDGHHLELIWFPDGKGDPRWRRSPEPLFLGIDHTAIVVGDTDRSLRFYRDLLGFVVQGESRNYGTEQEHLNNVEGASLRITGLRLPKGLGVELLEYLAPATGRPFPADARANDLVHWHTLVAVQPGESLPLLAASGAPIVSRGAAAVGDTTFGYRRGLMARDPDGHAVMAVER